MACMQHGHVQAWLRVIRSVCHAMFPVQLPISAFVLVLVIGFCCGAAGNSGVGRRLHRAHQR